MESEEEEEIEDDDEYYEEIDDEDQLDSQSELEDVFQEMENDDGEISVDISEEGSMSDFQDAIQSDNESEGRGSMDYEI